MCMMKTPLNYSMFNYKHYKSCDTTIKMDTLNYSMFNYKRKCKN